MRLAKTQDDLYALVTGFGAGPKRSARKIVKGTRALNPLVRVRIYGDQYFWRMYEALSQDFPKATSLLSERTLRQVVKRYATDCPSRHWDLGRFGSRFVEWLKTHRVPGARADLVDLAALEWARGEAFLARDATPIDAVAMAKLGAEALPGARLTFVPSCQLLKLEHEVAALFEARKEDPRPETRDPSVSRPIARSQHIVVWRKGFVVWHAVVQLDEAKALKAAMAGKPLALVLGHFARREDPARAAFQALGSWVNEGMVSRVEA